MAKDSPAPFRPIRWDDSGDPAGPKGKVRPFRPLELDESAPPEREPPAPAGPEPEAPGGEAPGPDPREAARAEAEALLARARDEAEALREAAREEGFREGQERAREEVAQRIEALEGLLRELAEWKPRLYEEGRAQVLELVLALVRKILGPLSEQCEEAVVYVTERALQSIADRENVTVRVHPDDLQAVVDAKPAFLETVDGIRQLTVVEDPSVSRGGCRVQTPTAEIDARLETQLEELVRVLRGNA